MIQAVTRQTAVMTILPVSHQPLPPPRGSFPISLVIAALWPVNIAGPRLGTELEA
jgi:hypothetical protein